MSTNTLYQLVNVYLEDKTWVGQFMNEDAAKAWLKAKGIQNAEITKRRPREDVTST
jgi:hypothetical protein